MTRDVISKDYRVLRDFNHAEGELVEAFVSSFLTSPILIQLNLIPQNSFMLSELETTSHVINGVRKKEASSLSKLAFGERKAL
jgi:hypothetical protein